jgi:hypothetical protein
MQRLQLGEGDIGYGVHLRLYRDWIPVPLLSFAGAIESSEFAANKQADTGQYRITMDKATFDSMIDQS